MTRSNPTRFVFAVAATVFLAACGAETPMAPVDPPTDPPVTPDPTQPQLQAFSGATQIQSGQSGAARFSTARVDGPDATLSIRLRNNGGADLDVSAIQLPTRVTGSLTGPLTLGPNQEETLALTLSTESVFVLDDVIQVTSNDPTHPTFTIPVTGQVAQFVAINRQPNPAVDAFLQNIMTSQQVVGLGVGIVKDGEIVYLEGRGFEDRENSIPVDPEATRFRWASTAKSVTGLATFIASEKGELDLDRTIVDYIPEYSVPTTYAPDGCTSAPCTLPIPAQDRVITARQLTGHHAGVRHYHNSFGPLIPPTSQTDNPATNTGMWWAIESTWMNSPLVSIPGQEHDYTTFGYNLLGVVLERATGMSFADWVDQEIAEPMGMTTFEPDYLWGSIPRRAVGYVQDGGSIVPDGDNDVTWKLGGGGFVSTVEDFARYCGSLMGNVVVSEQRKNEGLWQPLGPTWTELQFVDPALIGYGFGFFIENNAITHSGGQQSAATIFRILPSENTCIVYMTNSVWSNVNEVMTGLENAFLN